MIILRVRTEILKPILLHQSGQTIHDAESICIVSLIQILRLLGFQFHHILMYQHQEFFKSEQCTEMVTIQLIKMLQHMLSD